MRETQNVALQTVVLERHGPLLERWLRSSHVVRWWGVQEGLLSALAGRSPDSHAIITAGDTPVGYLCWQRLTREELETAHLSDLRANVMDIDIMIGEPAYVGQGIGPQALRLLLKRLADDGVELAGVGTSVRNRSAIRAFEKAGFGSCREFDGPDGRCRYLVTPPRNGRLPCATSSSTGTRRKRRGTLAWKQASRPRR